MLAEANDQDPVWGSYGPDPKASPEGAACFQEIYPSFFRPSPHPASGSLWLSPWWAQLLRQLPLRDPCPACRGQPPDPGGCKHRAACGPDSARPASLLDRPPTADDRACGEDHRGQADSHPRPCCPPHRHPCRRGSQPGGVLYVRMGSGMDRSP